jgi:hypothetical protein
VISFAVSSWLQSRKVDIHLFSLSQMSLSIDRRNGAKKHLSYMSAQYISRSQAILQPSATELA